MGGKGVGDKHQLTRPLSAIFLPSVTDFEPIQSSSRPLPWHQGGHQPPTVDRRRGFCNQSNNDNDWAALWLSHWQSPALYPGYLKPPPSCCNFISSFHGHFELEGYHSLGIYKPLSFSLTPFDQSNVFFFFYCIVYSCWWNQTKNLFADYISFYWVQKKNTNLDAVKMLLACNSQSLIFSIKAPFTQRLHFLKPPIFGIG